MNKSVRKVIYRLSCVISVIIGFYLVADFIVSGTLNINMIVVFVLTLLVFICGVVDHKIGNELIKSQEKELKLYQLYIQPMEELVKEIRASQHEFDNHINAILNMHFTVDNYDELVQKQSSYIQNVRRDGMNRYLQLLRISDKVLAGFLYSKIVNSPENVETDVVVKNWTLLSGIAENNLIEIIGILVDNAYEACQNKDSHVKIVIDSQNDRLIFEIMNSYKKVTMEELGKFFENGYSTKTSVTRKRGIGLVRAKHLIEKAKGEITVGQEEIEGENYIHFTVIV